MEKDETFSDEFHKNNLSPKILSDGVNLARYEYENILKPKTYTPIQQLHKQIFGHFIAIQTVIQDLEKTIVFLKIDYSKILEIYPNLPDRKSYYVYHFENYIIRVNTISDLCGKIGNSICKTGISDEKCNGYNFKEEIKKSNNTIANKITEILAYTKELKDVRHTKIHKGKTEIKNLNDVILWSDIAKYTNQIFDDSDILDEMTTLKINEEIDRIEAEILGLIKILNEYFNLLDIEYSKL